MNYRNFIYAAIATTVWLSTAAPAPADLSLDVAPAKYEIAVTPGATQTIPITVRNSSDQPLHIQASLSDFKVKPNGDYLFLTPGQNSYSIAKYASINPREFDLAPNTIEQIRFSFSAPANLSGEYSGIVFFTTRPPRHAKGSIAFAERIASKIYVYRANSVRIDGAVSAMTEKDTGIGPHFAVSFKNTGNAHVYLNGRIDIKKGDATVATVPLPAQQLVERGEMRTVEAYGTKLPAGKYSAIALIDYGGTNLAGGEISFVVH